MNNQIDDGNELTIILRAGSTPQMDADFGVDQDFGTGLSPPHPPRNTARDIWEQYGELDNEDSDDAEGPPNGPTENEQDDAFDRVQDDVDDLLTRSREEAEELLKRIFENLERREVYESSEYL